MSDEKLKSVIRQYQMEKQANLYTQLAKGLGRTLKPIGTSIANLGKGTWNLALGGKTIGDKWQPFYGLNRLGRPQATYSSGPLAGMRKIDPKTGEPVLSEKRNVGRYLKQEWEGSRPRRSDFLAEDLTKKKSQLQKAEANLYGTKAPGGTNRGQFLDDLQKSTNPRDKALLEKLQSIDKQSFASFVKQNPQLAAKYYGLNLLQKGFLGALPAYEAYNIMENRTGPIEGKGPAANLGYLAGSSLGFLGGGPLGLVGATGVAEGLGRGGQALGSIFDRSRRNRIKPTKENDPKAIVDASKPQLIKTVNQLKSSL